MSSIVRDLPACQHGGDAGQRVDREQPASRRLVGLRPAPRAPRRRGTRPLARPGGPCTAHGSRSAGPDGQPRHTCTSVTLTRPRSISPSPISAPRPDVADVLRRQIEEGRGVGVCGHWVCTGDDGVSALDVVQVAAGRAVLRQDAHGVDDRQLRAQRRCSGPRCTGRARGSERNCGPGSGPSGSSCRARGGSSRDPWRSGC